MSLIKLKLAGAPAALKTPKAILSPAKTPKSCVIPDNTILTPDKIIAADKNYALLYDIMIKQTVHAAAEDVKLV